MARKRSERRLADLKAGDKSLAPMTKCSTGRTFVLVEHWDGNLQRIVGFGPFRAKDALSFAKEHGFDPNNRDAYPEINSVSPKALTDEDERGRYFVRAPDEWKPTPTKED
jgi:hypothetical protein